jgi:MafB19-like deaminase
MRKILRFEVYQRVLRLPIQKLSNRHVGKETRIAGSNHHGRPQYHSGDWRFDQSCRDGLTARSQPAAAGDGRTRTPRVLLYVTLEPCLMCSAALSFAGIKRIVYAALAEDANLEEMIVRDLTLPSINQQLVRGPFNLVPGVHRRPGLTAPDEQNGRGAGRSQNVMRLGCHE